MSLEEMRSHLAPEIQPRQLLRCAPAVRSSKIQAYFTLVSEKRVRVEDMARKLRKSRATAQRLLQDLVSKGLAIRAESLSVVEDTFTSIERFLLRRLRRP